MWDVRGAGPTRVRVIGIDTGEINARQIVYFPSQVLERLDGTPGAGNSIWFTTASTSILTIVQILGLVIRGPLRRATRIQPGTALRYQ